MADPSVSAVLVADKGGPVNPACRPWLEGVIAGAGFKLLPADTDPVKADVVFTVKLQIHGSGPRRGAALEVNAFETATAARVAAAAELGRPAEGEAGAVDHVCKAVADQLSSQLSAWSRQVAEQGMPISMSFRFEAGLEPAPGLKLQTFLKAGGFDARPALSTSHQIRYVLHTKQSPDAFRARLEGFLKQNWKTRRGPPSNLPGNPRILIYVLEDRN